jgi:D-glycero-alpha-D-manno-heptose 1-phosphate guanylyltransferase
MHAIVLAGGLGTRLQSVVSDVPKPMAPVGGRPFLEWLLEALAVGGVASVTLAVGYRGELVEAHFGLAHGGLAIDYSREESPLGTGGAILQALRGRREERVFVLNGDTFLELSYREMYGAAQAADARFAMALRPVDDCARYGAVRLEGDRVVALEEKGRSGAGLINAGVYLMAPDLLDDEALPAVFSFEEELLARRLGALRPLAHRCAGYFIDIGVPDEYERAQAELPARFGRPRS